jgi:formylglycine-generating enzyme required for sulfatase activity
LYQEIIEDRRIVAVILQTNGGKRRVDVTRMKRIPPGHVALGDRHGRLRTHLEQLPSLSGKPEVIDELLAEWQEPTQTTLGAYWIDRYEVTNAQYAEFLNATAHPAPEDWNGNEPPPGREEHPVVHIDQRSADAYAKWAGKQLPTADHWLRAFRDDTEQFYPWGNVFEPGRCNVAANPNQTGTSSVEATPEDVSPHNVFNLAGNVREYLRELSLDRFGNEVVECRGADWSSPGDLAAIGTYRSLFPADEAAQREVGFRCIVEVPRVR